MKIVEVFPNAKINLGLQVTGKLPSGYHTLETVFYPINFLFDEMSITESSNLEIITENSIENIPIKKHLCYKAFQKIKDTFPEISNVKIHLKKNIPSGAGLGGGSSDAAFTLLALRDLFDLEISNEELAEMAVEIGADVPFFLYNQPMYAEGIGEKLTILDLTVNGEIEIFPNEFHLSTADIFGMYAIKTEHHTDLRKCLEFPVDTWQNCLHNDLERPAFQKIPKLRKQKEDLYTQGAKYASMTGSGSALYAIF